MLTVLQDLAAGLCWWLQEENSIHLSFVPPPSVLSLALGSPLPQQEETVFGVVRRQHKELEFILLFFLLETRHLTWRRED